MKIFKMTARSKKSHKWPVQVCLPPTRASVNLSLHIWNFYL